jgi:hypothetical protein
MSNPSDQAPSLAEGDPANNVVGTHGDDSSDSEDEEFDDARSNRSTR